MAALPPGGCPGEWRLGSSLLIPVKLGGMIGLACAYVFVMDWHLGATLAGFLPSAP